MKSWLRVFLLAMFPTVLFAQDDALPNPFSPEGIRAQKEWTRRQLQQVDDITLVQVHQVGRIFLRAVASGDIGLVKTVVIGESSAVVQDFDHFTSQFAKARPNLSEFTFGVIYVSEGKDRMIAAMLNRDSIMTARLILERIGNQWTIRNVR